MKKMQKKEVDGISEVEREREGDAETDLDEVLMNSGEVGDVVDRPAVHQT